MDQLQMLGTILETFHASNNSTQMVAGMRQLEKLFSFPVTFINNEIIKLQEASLIMVGNECPLLPHARLS